MVAPRSDRVGIGVGAEKKSVVIHRGEKGVGRRAGGWLATGVGAGENAEDLGVAGGIGAESGATVLVEGFHFAEDGECSSAAVLAIVRLCYVGGDDLVSEMWCVG